MNGASLPNLLGAATAMGFLVAGLFFLRFWRDTADRFFAFFAVAMWIFAINWATLAMLPPITDGRHYAYLIRLAAFVVIIGAIADKNRTNYRS
jgi:hypothetical protein